MKGSCQQNKDYCSKEESRSPGTQPIEFGTMPVQGKRSDISSFTDGLKEGSSMKDLAIANPEVFVRYHRGLQTFNALLMKEREHMTKLEVFWGPTGSGKSTGVRRLLSERNAKYFQMTKSMVSSSGVVWFDGYDPSIHEYLVIDDFYGWIPLHFFLNLIDSHPMAVQYKGGSVPFACKGVMITSNDDPKTWYKEENLSPSVYAAYSRRLLPPWATISFVGYGPEKDLTHCPCKEDGCPFLHQDFMSRAIAPGVILPPKNGFKKARTH